MSRDLTVDGEQIRLFEVPIEITTDVDSISPDRLREVTDDVQAHLDEFVNGQHTLGGSHTMHVRIDPTFVSSHAPPSDRVRVTVRDTGDVDQRTWSTDPAQAPKLVHEVMHFVGAREGYRADHHLLRTPKRPGVMGDGVDSLPRRGDDTTDAPPYLTDVDVDQIHTTWQDATPQQAGFTPTPHGDLPPSTTPARAPKTQPSATPPAPATQSTAQPPAGGRKRRAPATATGTPGPAPKRPRTTTASSSTTPKPKKAKAERRPIVADSSQLTPAPRPNADGTVPSSIYRTDRDVRATQPDLDATGKPKKYQPGEKLHQLGYGPKEGLSPSDLAKIGRHVEGVTGQPTITLHTDRYTGLPDQTTIVESAVAAGDGLTAQERDRQGATSNDPETTRNHIIAAGAGQNALNRAILNGVDGHERIAQGQAELRRATIAGDTDGQDSARRKIQSGNAQVASGIARFQQYARAIVQEPRAATEQRSDEQVRTDRDDALVQLTRLVDSPERRDGRFAALDALDPSATTSHQGPTGFDAVRTLSDVIDQRLTSTERQPSAQHLRTLLHGLGDGDRQRVESALDALGSADADGSGSSHRPTPDERALRRLHDLVGDAPFSGRTPTTRQRQDAADALRSQLTPDRQADYREVLRRSTDSTGNVRVGDRAQNGLVSTGFDVELDIDGNPTPRSTRLFDAHLAAKPDHDEQIFTSVSGSGDRLSSSIQVDRPTTTEPAGTPDDPVKPSPDVRERYAEQQADQAAGRSEQPIESSQQTRQSEQPDGPKQSENTDQSTERPVEQQRRADTDLPFRPAPDAPPVPSRPAPSREAPATSTASGSRRPVPPLPGPDPRRAPARDEGWRHASQRTATWSNPTTNPVTESEWRPRLASATPHRVDLRVADVRADGRNGRVGRFEGIIAYDRARVVMPDGRAVQVYTVRVNLRPGDGVTPGDVAAAQQRARSSVDAIINRGFRLPRGDQLHVDVQFTDANPHLTVDAVAPVDEVGDTGVGPGGRPVTSTDQRHWRTDESGRVFTHELLHSLGLADESIDRRRVLQRDAGNTAVHHDDGIMSDGVHRESTALYPRNIWAIERLADGQHQLPDGHYSATALLQGQPLPLSAVDSPADLHTQVADHLGVTPQAVRDELGLSDESTAAETAAAWRGVLDAGSITVDGRTADVSTGGVRVTVPTPTDPAVAAADADADAETEAADDFSRTQDVETSTKTSIGNTTKVEGQLTVSVGPTPGFPAATFGMSTSTGADLGLKTTLRDTSAPKAASAPSHANVTLNLTTDGRTSRIDVDTQLSLPDVEHAGAAAPIQRARPAGHPTLSTVDLKGIRPNRVTTLSDGAVKPRSQRDVDALTSVLTASGDTKAKGDTSTFSVDDAHRPQTSFVGIAKGGGKTSRGTAFSSGWSKGSELSATAGARGRLFSFLRFGGALTATHGGGIGGSSELKHSTARSDDDKVAIYSLSRTVQVKTGLFSSRPVEVRTTFSVPIVDAAARGLWLPDAVRPGPMDMTPRLPGGDAAFDPSRDSFISVPTDLSNQIVDGLGLSDAGKAAVASKFDGETGKASLHDAATGGTTAVWHEDGRTHRVTVTAEVDLGEPFDTSDGRTSKHEESLASKRDASMDSKAGQSGTVGTQAIASIAPTDGGATTAASPTNIGAGIAQLSAGHQRSAKNSASHTVKDTRTASSTGPAGYHPTITRLTVTHESTKDANFLQRGLAGGRLLGSGDAALRHRVETPAGGHRVDVDGVAVRRPQLDGSAADASGAHTRIGTTRNDAFVPIDTADLGTFAKVERVDGHQTHADLLESALSKRADLAHGDGRAHRSPIGSGNFSSWGSRAFDGTAGSPILTRSPFTKPGEVTASTMQALGSDAGLRTIANAGLGDRSVGTGNMKLLGKLGNLHGSVDVRQKLGNPSFVTTRQERTLLRGSSDERAVGTSKEWSVNVGADGLVRGTAPGGKDNLLLQIGAKLGYTYGRSRDAEQSMGTTTERSKTGETAVLRFDAERTYTPSLELRRFWQKKGFDNPPFTRFEPGSVDVELPVREAAALLQRHGIPLPQQLAAHAPTPDTAAPATDPAVVPDPNAAPDPNVVADPPPGLEGGIELAERDPNRNPNPNPNPNPDPNAARPNPAADPLAAFRDDSDAVVGESTVSKADLDRMDRTWRPTGMDADTRKQILAEVRRVLTETSGSGFVRDAIVKPNRITVPLPAGPFTQRTATIEITVDHRADPADPATTKDVSGEKLSNERSGGASGKRNRFHQFGMGLDGRAGFFGRADEVKNLPGGEAAASHDWTLFNRRRDKSSSAPVSPKIAVTAEHESLVQHHMPVGFTVDVQLHEHVGGALDSLMPRRFTPGTHTALPQISLNGSLDMLEPKDSPDRVTTVAPPRDAHQHQLPALGAWRPMRWDHAKVADVQAMVGDQLGADGAARPGDVYDEALSTSISNGMLFNAIPRIAAGETFGIDELIARRGAFRDLRSDLAISGGIVQPSIRPGSTAPSTTLSHSIDLGTGAGDGRKRADDSAMGLPFGLSGMTDAGLVFAGLTPSYKMSSSQTDENGVDVKTSEKITHTGRSFIVDAHLRLRISAGTSTIVSSGGPRQPGEVDVPVVLQVWEQQLSALGLQVPADPAADTARDAARDADDARERRERNEAAARETEARDAREAAAQRARTAERQAERERVAREQAERDARDQEERDRRIREREERQRAEREQAERERVEREARERRARNETAEREARERAEQLAAEERERAGRERAARQERERIARNETAEREARERAEQLAAEQREADPTPIDDGYEPDDEAGGDLDDDLGSESGDSDLGADSDLGDDAPSGDERSTTAPRPTPIAPVDDAGDMSSDEYVTASEGEEYVTADEGEGEEEPPSRPAPPRPRADTPPIAPTPAAASTPSGSIPGATSTETTSAETTDPGVTRDPAPAGSPIHDAPGAPEPTRPRPDTTWIPRAPMSGYVPEEEDELDDHVLLPDGTQTGDGSTFDAQAFFDDALTHQG
ncbi:hypothetical protein BJ979_000576 [Schumannella luteola]|uniref:Uncharacterized protein n=1 Tax=Schumannella luteola TaxID=472059 RepID=A0A852Y997_9MICO|nr:hypothetical protein [Schumannella luteola]